MSRCYDLMLSPLFQKELRFILHDKKRTQHSGLLGSCKNGDKKKKNWTLQTMLIVAWRPHDSNDPKAPKQKNIKEFLFFHLSYPTCCCNNPM